MENEITKVETQLTPQDYKKENIDKIRAFMKYAMRDNEDYGVIPGTKKPSLYKSGAEKIEQFFGLTHKFWMLDKVEDWENGLFFYRYKCEVFDRHGKHIGECIASCNNKEKGRSNQDAFTTINTIDKMAQKRAFVGAILSASRASFIFTQDMEDFQEAKEEKQEEKKQETFANACHVCHKGVSQKVADFSKGKYQWVLCMDCQKEAGQ